MCNREIEEQMKKCRLNQQSRRENIRAKHASSCSKFNKHFPALFESGEFETYLLLCFDNFHCRTHNFLTGVKKAILRVSEEVNNCLSLQIADVYKLV